MSASSAPATVERGKITKKGIAADHPTWCPGCGDFAVLAAFFKTLEKLQFPQENIVTIAGIGCLSRFPYFVNTHGGISFMEERCHSRRALAWDAMICMYSFLGATATGSRSAVITWIMLGEKISASRM